MTTNDPRFLAGYDENDASFQTVFGDNTITVPAFGVQGLSNSPSAQQGMAVANVATGLNPPQAGLSSAGHRLFGKIKSVDVDGTITIQTRGWMALPYVTGGSIPVIDGAVDVDGTGNVQASATFRGAVCEGFVVDPATGSTVCLVRKL